MTDQKPTPQLSLNDRTIRLGDTTVELSEREIRWRMVEYLYLPPQPLGGRPPQMERRLASPEEVLQVRYPDINFQVSEDGYESMKAKAERILALQRRGTL